VIQSCSITPQEGKTVSSAIRRSPIGVSAGVTRRHSSVLDALAQLSEAKMADMGDERTVSTIYAPGQMSLCSGTDVLLRMPSMVDRVGGACMTAARS
jgi:hypothetical protein